MTTVGYNWRSPVSVAALLLAVLGLFSIAARSQTSAATTKPTPSPILHGDAAHPAKTRGWLDTKLYFGLGPADDPSQGVSEATWREFLDTEVTPRFPAGLSVMDIYGQWQSKRTGKVARIRSKMLVIDYPATHENAVRIEAIRAAWKKLTGSQSVLRVTEPADVSF
jgi:hypothetical protein